MQRMGTAGVEICLRHIRWGLEEFLVIAFNGIRLFETNIAAIQKL